MGGLMGGGKPDTSAAEDYSSKKRALSRGGKRMLLAEGRLTPETGIDEEDPLKPTLGA